MNAAEVEALIQTDRGRFWIEVQKLPSEYDRLRLLQKAVKARAHLKRPAAYAYLASLVPRLEELAPSGDTYLIDDTDGGVTLNTKRGPGLNIEKLKKEGKIT